MAKKPGERYSDWGEFAQALSGLVTTQQVPRGQFQGVLDSERFTLLRTLEFFANFGDVELWEVVHRAKWQRFHFGHALFRKGEEGNTFHIMAQGEVEVFRDGKKVAQLGAGTSVGEMAYLAPSAELKKHSTDVIITEPTTTISFTPETLHAAQPELPAPVPRLLHQGPGAPPALGPRAARPPASHPVSSSLPFPQRHEMQRLPGLSAALALIVSAAAFANSHKEAPHDRGGERADVRAAGEDGRVQQEGGRQDRRARARPS